MDEHTVNNQYIQEEIRMKYAYTITLDGRFISQSNFEYDSYDEAESEGYFAVRSYADMMNVDWSEFVVTVECA